MILADVPVKRFGRQLVNHADGCLAIAGKCPKQGTGTVGLSNFGGVTTRHRIVDPV